MHPSPKPAYPSHQRAGGESAPAAGAQAASLSSDEILRGQKTVEIRHNGLTYRLQATRLGKLILTK